MVQRLFKIFLALFSATIVAAVAVSIWGSRLPKEYSVTTIRVIAAPPERLYEWASQPRHFRAWRSDLAKVSPPEPAISGWDGPAAAGWREEIVGGEWRTLARKAAKPPAYLAWEQDPAGLPFERRWYLRLEAAGNGRTRLLLREDGADKNPFFRFFRHKIYGADAEIVAWAEGLARLAAASKD